MYSVYLWASCALLAPLSVSAVACRDDRTDAQTDEAGNGSARRSIA